MSRASGLEAELAAEQQFDVELVEGGKGVFDVVCDGVRVFSKHLEGRFPEEGEILDLLRESMAGNQT